jgi:drug/metabolite transporter (DMT)-like permease
VSGIGVTGRPGHINLAVFTAMVLVWGSSFLLIKICLEGMAPAQVAVIRSVLGAATLLGFLAVTRRRLPSSRRIWAHMAVVSLAQCSIPFTLTSWVGQYLPSSVSSIYNAVAPTLTVAFTPLLLRHERLSRGQLAGVASGVVGVVVLMAPWQHIDARHLGATLAPQVGMLLSAGIYAFGLVYMRRFVSGTAYDGVSIAATQVVLAAIPLVLLAPLTSTGHIRLTPRIAISMALLGVLGTGIAYVWNTHIVRTWGAMRASTVTYLMPLVGVVLGIVLLGERVQPHEPVGGLIILLGVLAARVPTPPPS